MIKQIALISVPKLSSHTLALLLREALKPGFIPATYKLLT
jgi:hypothetical protein